MKIAALVAAAGAGLRMNTTERKQYIILEEKPVLARSLNLFVEHPAVTEIIAIVPPGDTDVVVKLLEPFCPMERIMLVEGGNTRQKSVSRGLRAISSNVELVCIHDAARPLASIRLLDRLIKATHRCDAVVPVIALTDTVKEVSEDGFVLLTPERERLRLVQTPQVFKRQLIIDAYEEAAKGKVIATDDASLVELLGKPVMTVPGETVNLKITSSLDLLIASLILKGAGNN